MKPHRLLFQMIALAGMLIPTGCADDWEKPSEDLTGTDGYISITLRSSSLTRATEDGIDKYNENKIESAVLLLYPDDGTAGSVETYLPTVSQIFRGIDSNNTTILQVVLSETAKGRLFGSNGTSQCRAYVFTNLPRNVVDGITPQTTAAEIKAMTISSPFESSEVQTSFVMDGVGTVSLANDGKSASGTVNVQRAAAKVTLAIRVPQSIATGEGDQQTTWYSQLDNMRAAIIDGVMTSAVVPANHTNTDDDYYSMPTQATQGNGPRSLHEVEGVSHETDYPYVVNIPFYSYPNSWTENAEETHRTFITLMVPWREGTDGSFRTSYYQVPINKSTSIARNVSYRINLNVGVLGSFVPDEPFELTDCSYTAVDWSHENIDVSISDYRYLVVDQEYYVVNNEPSISIPLYSSHPVVVQNVTATYYRYNVTSQGNETPVTITQQMNNATRDFTGGRTGANGTQIPSNNGRSIWTCDYVPNSTTDANGLLNLHHDMIQWQPRERIQGGTWWNPQYYYPEIKQSGLPGNIALFTPTTEPEYSRVEFLITVIHEGHPEFSQTVRVVQYPAMYIETIQNITNTGTSAESGNMYVNGNQTQLGEYDNYNWLTAYGLSSSSNANPNQYILNVNNLSTSDYIIGDPRNQSYTNLGFNNTTQSTNTSSLNDNWYLAQDMNGRQRGLTYYYPTDSGEDKTNYIAPKIRIASSYGVCYPIDYEQAQRRCASYQEMMAPAGRWRIPTVGEIEYIISLSNNGYIPRLFSTNSNYWSAQGIINTGSWTEEGRLVAPTNLSGTSAVRCVYDEWYWGNDTIPGTGTGAANTKKYPFTWGDRVIDFSEGQTRVSGAKRVAGHGNSLIDIIRNK